jgi:transposase
MDERLRFVARLLDGERMAPLCREFGISRKTGYKIFNRYKDDGLRGLQDGEQVEPASAEPGNIHGLRARRSDWELTRR